MAHQVIKWIKGRPYLYEGTSYREGGKVRKKWRYLRPATEADLQRLGHDVVPNRQRGSKPREGQNEGLRSAPGAPVFYPGTRCKFYLPCARSFGIDPREPCMREREGTVEECPLCRSLNRG